MSDVMDEEINRLRLEDHLRDKLDISATIVIGFLLYFSFYNVLMSEDGGTPYSYWTFVRIIYSATALYLLFKFLSFDEKYAIFPLFVGIILLLFNPIFIVTLPSEVWIAIHFVYFIFLYFILLKKNDKISGLIVAPAVLVGTYYFVSYLLGEYTLYIGGFFGLPKIYLN